MIERSGRISPKKGGDTIFFRKEFLGKTRQRHFFLECEISFVKSSNDGAGKEGFTTVSTHTADPRTRENKREKF